MQNKTKTTIFFGVVGIALIVILANYFFSELVSREGNPIKRVYIRDALVKAEVVSEAEKIERGLAGRENLPAGRGMLFDMPDNEVQNFWMKGMRFPIDIVWIESGRVTGCEKNVSPTDARIFTSPGDARYVLEVPAGFCDANRVKVNDEVRI